MKTRSVLRTPYKLSVILFWVDCLIGCQSLQKKWQIFGTFLLVFGGVGISPSVAQWVPQTHMESDFARQLDAVRWNFQTRMMWQDEGYYVRVHNVMQSRLFLSGGQAQNIQDENFFSMRTNLPLNSVLSLRSEAQSYRFTTTDLSQEFIIAGLRYQHKETLYAEFSGGFFSDSRSGQTDQGRMYSGRFGAENLSWGNVTLDPFLFAQNANIHPRTHEHYRSGIRADFRQQDIRLQSELSVSRAIREGYQPSSFFNRNLTDIIESIQSDTSRIVVRSQFPLTEILRGELDFSAQSVTRSIQSRWISDEDNDAQIYDSEAVRNQFFLVAAVHFDIGVHRFRWGTEVGYQSRSSELINTEQLPEIQVAQRNRQLLNSNFEQSTVTLFADTRFLWGDATRLDITGQMRILRYDTPSINNDDRDEQLFLIQTALEQEISPFLTAFLLFGGEATHLVYLSSERSIENNWRRSIRMMPRLRWQPGPQLIIDTRFLVRANYTVQDFQLPGRPATDQSSREMAMATEIQYNITDEWQLDTRISRSELRIGRLDWANFRETPTDTLISWEGELMLGKKGRNYEVRAGGRYFLKRDYLPRTTLVAEIIENDAPITVSQTGSGVQYTHQIGPVVDLVMPFSSGNYIVVRGWVQHQLVRRSLYVAYPDEFRSAFREAERKFQRRVFPNIELRMHIRF